MATDTGPTRPHGGGPRNSVIEIHQQLRQQIIANQLEAGTEVNQARLAKALGVSRGPVREALRMLQDEGLVEAWPNLRPRVAPIHAEDVDSLYAQRILLEALGVMVTVPGLAAAEIEHLRAQIQEMLDVRHDRDAHTKVHHDFHRLLVSTLPLPLLTSAERLFSQTERYRRFYSGHAPRSGAIAATEHRQILDACAAHEVNGAATVLAEHYTRTALHVLAILAPEYEPRAVRSALTLVKQGASP